MLKIILIFILLPNMLFAADLSWDASIPQSGGAPIIGYRVYWTPYKEYGGRLKRVGTNKKDVGNVTTITNIDTYFNLRPNTQYAFNVEGISEDGYTGKSEFVLYTATEENNGKTWWVGDGGGEILWSEDATINIVWE